MRKFLFLLSFILLTGKLAFSSDLPTDTLQGNITNTVTLQSSKIYLIKGEVHVKSGGDIVIPAGTKLYGSLPSGAGSDGAGSLIIERGGQIHANGTAANPVIFTSSRLPGQRLAGDWGGVVLLGKAKINTPTGADTASIEGFANSIYYGGQNDDDNSGVMRYVRIEYAGIALSANNEINSLTMGGVGRGTTIEYIMCTYGGDDSYEWFGGTVNCKYLVSAYPVDDNFDTDNGFRGRVQFGLVVTDRSIADVSLSNGFESDNNAAPNYNNPRTQPIFSNITMIGPKQFDTTTVSPLFGRAFHLRRNSLQNVYNAVFMGYGTGVLFDGAGVGNACNGDTIKFVSNILAGISGKNFDSTGTASTGFNPTGFALASTRLNDTLNTNAQVMLSNPYAGFTNHNYSTANFMPQVGSPALDPLRATLMTTIDPFFTATTYRGAFGLTDWGANWTNFRPDTVNYKPVGINQISVNVPEQYNLRQNYPNPFNPSTKIQFALPKSGLVSLKVYDAVGREVANLVNENLNIGTYEYTFDAARLTSGIYFYTIKTEGYIETKKMLLIK